MSRILIEGKNLSKEFPAGRKKKLHAVTDVSIRIYEGETLGLVGESGCGKSTLGKMLIRMIEPTSGELMFREREVSRMSSRDFRPFRKELQMIFQDPYASLNPRMTVRDLIAEPLETWKVCRTKEETTGKVLELMKSVGVPGEFLQRYPHQFSGGQRQRIGIARAIALDPALIVCDEPVSALDVSVQNQILNLMNELQASRGLSYLFISHDLSVVRHIADRVAVMFLGRVLEYGPVKEIYQEPKHPYTRFLLNAVPVPDPHRREEQKILLKGEPPSPVDLPAGCIFHTRCPFATELCRTEMPKMRQCENTEVACHFPGIR